MASTRLHPPAFMSNLLEIAPLIRHGVLPNPSGHGACTWVDPADVAAAAYAVITETKRQGDTAGRRYLLTGTQPLSFPQIAVVLTDVLQHRIRPVPVPAPLLYAAVRAGGGPHWQARGMVAQFHDVVRRGLDGVRVHSNDLAQLLGREPTDMTDYLTTHAARFD